jgi:lambda family phage tail tape measure protein
LTNELIISQLELAEKLIKLDDEAGKLKVKSVGMDKLQSEILALELQRKTEIFKIDEQEKLNKQKINQTDIERAAITRQAATDRLAINQKIDNARALAIKTYDLEIEAIGRVKKTQETIFDLDYKTLILERNRYQMRETDVRIAQEKVELERKLADLEKQKADALARYGQGELYDAEIGRINDLINAEKSLSKARTQNIIEEEERRKSFTEGFQSAVRQFAIDAENYGKLGADLFSSAIGNMNSAVDNFVKTGKLNFKDFARSVIQDILAMMMKFQAMQMVMMGLRGMGFGSFGSTASIVGAPVSGSILPNMPMAAAGGMIDGPTIVGENGPELFVPSRSGTIVPNAQMGQAMAQQPAVVYNGPYIAQMSAIDTQSAVQFLAQNKQAIWAANQSAQRSLPVSR